MDYLRYVTELNNKDNLELLKKIVASFEIREILFMRKEYVMELLKDLNDVGEERGYTKILEDILKMQERKVINWKIWRKTWILIE